MALFISQKDDRTELQKQLVAELQRKAKETSKLTDIPDGVDDSQYIRGTKTTTSLAWVWIAIVIFVAAFIIWLTVVGMTR
jgi:type VI protein secretion system component VasF